MSTIQIYRLLVTYILKNHKYYFYLRCSSLFCSVFEQNQNHKVLFSHQILQEYFIVLNLRDSSPSFPARLDLVLFILKYGKYLPDSILLNLLRKDCICTIDLSDKKYFFNRAFHNVSNISTDFQT